MQSAQERNDYVRRHFIMTFNSMYSYVVYLMTLPVTQSTRIRREW